MERIYFYKRCDKECSKSTFSCLTIMHEQTYKLNNLHKLVYQSLDRHMEFRDLQSSEVCYTSCQHHRLYKRHCYTGNKRQLVPSFDHIYLYSVEIFMVLLTETLFVIIANACQKMRKYYWYESYTGVLLALLVFFCEIYSLVIDIHLIIFITDL